MEAIDLLKERRDMTVQELISVPGLFDFDPLSPPLPPLFPPFPPFPPLFPPFPPFLPLFPSSPRLSPLFPPFPPFLPLFPSSPRLSPLFPLPPPLLYPAAFQHPRANLRAPSTRTDAVHFRLARLTIEDPHEGGGGGRWAWRVRADAPPTRSHASLRCGRMENERGCSRDEVADAFEVCQGRGERRAGRDGEGRDEKVGKDGERGEKGGRVPAYRTVFTSLFITLQDIPTLSLVYSTINAHSLLCPHPLGVLQKLLSQRLKTPCTVVVRSLPPVPLSSSRQVREDRVPAVAGRMVLREWLPAPGRGGRSTGDGGIKGGESTCGCPLFSATHLPHPSPPPLSPTPLPHPSPAPLSPTPLPHPSPTPLSPTPLPHPSPPPLSHTPLPHPSPPPLSPTPLPHPSPTPLSRTPLPHPSPPPLSPTPLPHPSPAPLSPTPLPHPSPPPLSHTPLPHPCPPPLSPTPLPHPSPTPLSHTPLPQPSPTPLSHTPLPHPSPPPLSPTPLPHPSPPPLPPTPLTHPSPPPLPPTPLPHPSPTPLSHTPLPHPSPTPLSPTPLPHPSPTPLSPTPLPHPSPTPLSHTPLPHPSPPPLSHTPLPHPSPPSLSHTPLPHPSPAPLSPDPLSRPSLPTLFPDPLSRPSPPTLSPDPLPPHPTPVRRSPRGVGKVRWPAHIPSPQHPSFKLLSQPFPPSSPPAPSLGLPYSRSLLALLLSGRASPRGGSVIRWAAQQRAVVWGPLPPASGLFAPKSLTSLLFPPITSWLHHTTFPHTPLPPPFHPLHLYVTSPVLSFDLSLSPPPSLPPPNPPHVARDLSSNYLTGNVPQVSACRNIEFEFQFNIDFSSCVSARIAL
ncbi:unnamed protein product [Closterium sp. NIES-64]|nr:unnamed protein product [Closterium sp. NIES-64]